jgi:hypothetical protein
MTGLPLRLKQPTGWFAAGREVTQALNLLSDGAFKLFMWICLNADRGLGAIRLEPSQVAGILGNTEAEIRANLRDLFQAVDRPIVPHSSTGPSRSSSKATVRRRLSKRCNLR